MRYRAALYGLHAFYFFKLQRGEAGEKPYTKASKLVEAITKGEEMDSKREEGFK